MRARRALALVVVCLAGLPALASGQQIGGLNPLELFQQLDANNDRVIDKSEVPEAGRAAFDRLLKHGDANHDGKLEVEEYRTLLQDLANTVGGGRIAPQRFAALDKDGNGTLSREEFPGPAPLFQRLDTNKDGVLSREESVRPQAGAGGLPGGRFQALDKNGDGKLSREEFPGLKPLFDRLDSDKDGFISRQEAARFAGAGAAGAAPAARPAQRLKAMDKDNDGKVSRAEFTGAPGMFDRLDTDKDGYLTLQELRAGRAEPEPASKTSAGSNGAGKASQ